MLKKQTIKLQLKSAKMKQEINCKQYKTTKQQESQNHQMRKLSIFNFKNPEP